MMAAEFRFRSLPASPLPGVTAEAWARLTRALELHTVKLPDGREVLAPRPIDHVSASGGLGSYDLRPRRLVELGIGCRLRSQRTSAGGGRIYVCDFVPPLSQAQFLHNPVTQYQVLVRSMVDYHRALAHRPEGTSLAGALAILHRGGRGALARFPDLFPDTRALYERARGAF